MKISTNLLKNMEFVFLAAAVLACGTMYAKSHQLSTQPHSVHSATNYAKLHTAAPVAAHSHMPAPSAQVKNLSSNAVQTVLVMAKRIH